MTLTGVDYSAGPLTAAQVKAAGMAFVCRYVSSPGESKNLRPSEVADYLGNGVGLVVVYEEHPVTRPLGGFAEGVADARSADAQVGALGLPGCPVYFAVDFDAVPSQLPVIDSYIDGVVSVLGFARTGAYGSNRTITHLLDGGRIRYGWAAAAWGGTVDSRAHLYQTGGGIIDGVPVDVDHTVSSDTNYGQYQSSTGDWFNSLFGGGMSGIGVWFVSDSSGKLYAAWTASGIYRWMSTMDRVDALKRQLTFSGIPWQDWPYGIPATMEEFGTQVYDSYPPSDAVGQNIIGDAVWNRGIVSNHDGNTFPASFFLQVINDHTIPGPPAPVPLTHPSLLVNVQDDPTGAVYELAPGVFRHIPGETFAAGIAAGLWGDWSAVVTISAAQRDVLIALADAPNGPYVPPVPPVTAPKGG